MGLHKTKKGLRLPILGEPAQTVESHRSPRRVALVADDYPGMRPTMHVQVGDDVKRGQSLFEDKKISGVHYTSPGAGKVLAIHRGERRVLQSVVIELSRSELEGRAGGAEETSFRSFSGKHPRGMSGEEVRELLSQSGLWTALRARPFGHVADPAGKPHSLFVTAMDTNPLAPSVETVLEARHGDFERGLFAVSRLTDGPVFVCTAPASAVPVPQYERIRREEFDGPHPAGTVGVHIHWLDPVDRSKTVWHVNYQDVIAIGRLFQTGRLHLDRVISLAGPAVKKPRLIRTRLGASTDELTEGELEEGENRVISGSVFSGRKASGEVYGYLGRYHHQISVVAEDRERHFLGWLGPGLDKFSVVNAFFSKLLPGKKLAFTTSTNGSPRAIVPIGAYEKVMPMDLMPTFLLRALLMSDVERAEELGCLELDEEDLGLCTFVCPGKNDYGPYLRQVLTTIEKEG
ncbi:MAG: Na(+)-translocating NADH-quinone reductase subunit A [Acidobacteriota bacterium]